MTASAPKRPIKGAVLSVRLACAAGGSTCRGALKLTSRVTTVRRKVVAVAAAAKRQAEKRRTETVGNARYTVAPGTTKVIRSS